MKKSELIAKLNEIPGDPDVLLYDGEYGEYYHLNDVEAPDINDWIAERPSTRITSENVNNYVALK